jgi:hypothetical protein
MIKRKKKKKERGLRGLPLKKRKKGGFRGSPPDYLP